MPKRKRTKTTAKQATEPPRKVTTATKPKPEPKTTTTTTSTATCSHGQGWCMKSRRARGTRCCAACGYV